MARTRWQRWTAALAIGAACHATVLAGVPADAWAQQKSPVASLIKKGSDLFDDQSYEESIQTLSAALVRPGGTKEEKIEIYRLLAYNYITLKRTEEADASVRGILVLDEKFRLPASESPRFRDFFDATRSKWEAEGKPGRVAEGAGAAEEPVKIEHSSPPQVPPGTAIKLEGTVTDPSGRARAVQLHFRAGSTGKFESANGSFTMSHFRATIPASAVKPPLVEYYLEALDKGGLPVASRGDAAAPLRVVVPAPQKGGVLSSPFFGVPVGLVVVGGAVATALILTNQKSTSTVSVRVTE